VQVGDPHAMLKRLLGIDHRLMTYPHQGLSQNQTGVCEERVVGETTAVLKVRRSM
jgi:hypothetical protein